MNFPEVYSPVVVCILNFQVIPMLTQSFSAVQMHCELSFMNKVDKLKSASRLSFMEHSLLFPEEYHLSSNQY